VSDRVRLGGRQLAISIMFDVVKLEIICGDDYEASVLYDDLLERLRAGEDISISLSQDKREVGA
jgi:hypothetical protein